MDKSAFNLYSWMLSDFDYSTKTLKYFSLKLTETNRDQKKWHMIGKESEKFIYPALKDSFPLSGTFNIPELRSLYTNSLWPLI